MDPLLTALITTANQLSADLAIQQGLETATASAQTAATMAATTLNAAQSSQTAGVAVVASDEAAFEAAYAAWNAAQPTPSAMTAKAVFTKLAPKLKKK